MTRRTAGCRRCASRRSAGRRTAGRRSYSRRKLAMRVWAAAIVVVLGASLARAAEAPQGAAATIHADRPGPMIDRHIYGQFAEHLGRGIYEGVWVGEHSKIPNTRGFRNDVFAALRDLRLPVV